MRCSTSITMRWTASPARVVKTTVSAATAPMKRTTTRAVDLDRPEQSRQAVEPFVIVVEYGGGRRRGKARLERREIRRPVGIELAGR